MNPPKQTIIDTVPPPPYKEPFNTNQEHINIAQQNIINATNELINIFNQCGIHDNIDELVINIQNNPSDFINDSKPIVKNLAEKIIEYNSIKEDYDTERIILSTDNLKKYVDKQFKQINTYYTQLVSTELLNSQDQNAIILADKYINTLINRGNITLTISMSSILNLDFNYIYTQNYEDLIENMGSNRNPNGHYSIIKPNALGNDQMNYTYFKNSEKIVINFEHLTMNKILKETFNITLPEYISLNKHSFGAIPYDIYKSIKNKEDLIEVLYIQHSKTKQQYNEAIQTSLQLAIEEDNKSIIKFQNIIAKRLLNYNYIFI
jgi:hypothetical protein